MTWEKLNSQGTPIIDRRTDAPDEPSAEDLHSNEQDRLARRHNVKVRVAELEVKRQRADLLRAEIRRIDAEVEQAADLHQASCEPLQAELTELERLAIERIAKREPPDADQDQRRAEIVSEITEHNKTLETITERAKKLKAPLATEADKLSFDSAGLQAEENKLARIGIAKPELLVASYVARKRLDFATTRLRTARKTIQIYEENLDGIRRGIMGGDVGIQLHHLASCSAEIEAAAAEEAAALKETSEIHREKIAE